jgi:Ni/Co efflux regulator RcnB
MGEVVEETVTVGPDGRERRTVVRRPMNSVAAHHGGHGRYSRIEPGHRVPGYWMDRRFGIQDYGRYGLYQPMYGGRWVRYYDDALLVDPYGQVIDGEYGMRWDQHGRDWRHDERGIPEYAGTDGYYPDDEDYALGEDDYEHGGYGPQGYGHHAPQVGPIVITTTTVTTAPTVREQVRYEDAPARKAPRSYKRKSRARK